MVELHVKEAYRENYPERLQRAFPDTLSFPGCLAIEAFRNVEERGRITVMEQWQSLEDYKRYMEWRRSQGTLAEIGDMMASPMQVSILEKLA